MIRCHNYQEKIDLNQLFSWSQLLEITEHQILEKDTYYHCKDCTDELGIPKSEIESRLSGVVNEYICS